MQGEIVSISQLINFGIGGAIAVLLICRFLPIMANISSSLSEVTKAVSCLREEMNNNLKTLREDNYHQGESLLGVIIKLAQVNYKEEELTK
jgi:hypothetical protein